MKEYTASRLTFCVSPRCNLIMTKMYVTISRVNKRMQEIDGREKRVHFCHYGKSNAIRDPSLDCHFHIDLSMRLVSLHLEVVDGEVFDILHFPLHPQFREWQRLSSQLKKD